MATEQLKTIFLSASIPLPSRHERYADTADVLAIRDSITALASLLSRPYRLVWGGHPSITPIINFVIQRLGLPIQSRMTIYQSLYFQDKFPKDNDEFENIRTVDRLADRESSLREMRKRMLTDQGFDVGVFIGGMEGVEEEFELFKKYQSQAVLLPMASTGAAAKHIYERYGFTDDRLLNDYAYTSLFKELLE